MRMLPTALSRRQLLFIEATRFTIEALDLAYNRLCHTLPRLARNIDDGDSQEAPASVSAMLDAWAIIDSLHRLRGLIEGFPGLRAKGKSLRVRSFLERTVNVPALRNTIQHLNSEISGAVDDRNWGAFGSLSWGIVEPQTNLVVACSYMPGSPFGSRPMINPLSRLLWHLPVDSITIERSGIDVCISDAFRTVATLAASLEKGLAKAFAEQIPSEHQTSTHGADLVVRIDFQIGPDQIVPLGTPDPEAETAVSAEQDSAEE